MKAIRFLLMLITGLFFGTSTRATTSDLWKSSKTAFDTDVGISKAEKVVKSETLIITNTYDYDVGILILDVGWKPKDRYKINTIYRSSYNKPDIQFHSHFNHRNARDGLRATV